MALQSRPAVLLALLLAAATRPPTTTAAVAPGDAGAAAPPHQARAGGLRVSGGRTYARPDESLRAAFFEDIDNDEEMQALSEKFSKGYRQMAAKYVVKGSDATVATSV
mmetsp:Transcript_132864/g.331491  ORF Transcript_132864/g.331491 Transcript_132864/m.331491 type:complete len:108 (-) Transcript_132864:83-406(-)